MYSNFFIFEANHMSSETPDIAVTKFCVTRPMAMEDYRDVGNIFNR